MNLVIFYFGKIAKNNPVILSLFWSWENDSNFNDHMIRFCKCFLGLINMAGKLKKRKSNGCKDGNKRKKTSKKACSQFTDLKDILSMAIFQPGTLFGCSFPNDSENYLLTIIFHVFAGGKATEPLSQAKRDSNKFLNLYQKIYFDCVRKNVAAIWNCNDFWGEDKH